MQTTLLETICKAENLPSLPTVAIEVLQMMKSDDVSVKDMAKVVQNDPALAGKILKMVNSCLFGMSREIASINQAMVILGIRSVKVMILSFSLVDMLKKDKEGGLDYDTYWRRSLTCAVTAKLIAKVVVPQMTEEAFVAGLLSDLGMVAAWRGVPEEYGAVLEAWSTRERPLPEVECEKLGVSHAGMSAALLRTWNLPDILCNAVMAHHGEAWETLSGPSLELAKVLHGAAEIAGVFCQDIASTELDRVKEDCRKLTGISEGQLEEVLEALDQHVRDTASLLSVEVGDVLDYGQIQTEAVMHLTQLSVQAEVDRAKAARREEEARMEADRLNKEKMAIIEVASMDSMTQIANRAAFDKRLSEELDRAKVAGHSLSLIMLDVDHFKKFNDTYGHQAGDEVLRGVASCLREVGQCAGFVARYGGEEFAVIVPRHTPEALRELAEKIREAIEDKRVRHESHLFRVTASFGAARVQPQNEEIDSKGLIEKADQLLYQAKRNGRNRVETAS